MKQKNPTWYKQSSLIHFDSSIRNFNLELAENFKTNYKSTKYTFFPLIHYIKKDFKYKTKDLKERDIFYSSHISRLI